MGTKRSFSYCSAGSQSINNAQQTVSFSNTWSFASSTANIYIHKLLYTVDLIDQTTLLMIDRSVWHSKMIINIDPAALITSSALQVPTSQFLVSLDETAYFKSFNFSTQGFTAPNMVCDFYVKTLMVNSSTFNIRWYIEGEYEIQG